MSEFGSAAAASLLSRPYAERQLITVVSDATAAVARTEASTEESTEKGIDWATGLEIAKRKVVGKESNKIGKAAAIATVGATFGTLAIAAPAVVVVAPVAAGGYALGLLVRRELRKLTKLKQLRDEGVNVLPVAKSEAEALTFPVGHPRD